MVLGEGAGEKQCGFGSFLAEGGSVFAWLGEEMVVVFGAGLLPRGSAVL